MYCPLLCLNRDNNAAVSCGQCMEEACAWWVTVNGTGKCAICQLGA